MGKTNIGDGDMNPYDSIKGLCKWLRDNSSGAYRPANFAANLIEGLIRERDEARSELDEVSKRYTAMVIQNQAIAADNERLTEELQKQKEMTIACADELIQAASELSGIKKQEPVYLWKEIGETDWMECHKEWYWKCLDSPEHDTMLLYAKPVHQHSFTISGIGTFYADSELEITYLERLHGVGGKANLKEVT